MTLYDIFRDKCGLQNFNFCIQPRGKEKSSIIMKQFPLKHTPSYKNQTTKSYERDRWMILNIHSLSFFIRFISRELPSPTELFRVSGCRERLPIGFYRLPKARASVRTCFAVRFYYQIHSGDKSWPFNGPINRARCPITVLLITRPPIKMEKMKAKKI